MFTNPTAIIVFVLVLGAALTAMFFSGHYRVKFRLRPLVDSPDEQGLDEVIARHDPDLVN